MKKQGVRPYQSLNTPVLQVKFPSVSIIPCWRDFFQYQFERSFFNIEYNTQEYKEELTTLAEKADDLAYLMQGVFGLLTAVTDSVNRGTLGVDTDLLDAAMFLLLPHVKGFTLSFTEFANTFTEFQQKVQ